jgi:hypothetical protein
MSTDGKRIALDVVDWMWGTVRGAFNDKMDLSQIITDAVIGMIPVVGDVTAARDLIAISLGLAGDEKKREDKMQWVLLVIFVFALIPVFGGVVKGVGRLALDVTEDVARNAKVLEDVIAFLNRVGHGNAVKWFRELDVLKYQTQVLERFNALLDTLVKATERIRDKLGSVLPDSLLARLQSWGEGFKKVKQAGAKMIPEGIKELHAKLLRLQQLVYRGEWHTVTPGMRNVTREAEARLVEDATVTAERSAHGGWKQNPATEAHKSEIAKVYKWQEGYADLLSGTGPTAFEKEAYTKIAAFSGPIKAAKVQEGEYILRIHTSDSKTATGPWWVRLPPGVTEANWRDFMKNGKEWREVLAVLDEFSANGAFSLCHIKPGHSINAWEGRAAEQFGMKNPGQYLPGGLVQLYTEAWSRSFDDAVEWLVRAGKTGWTDLEDVGYAAGNVKAAGVARAQRLAANEEQSKRPATAGAH